MLRRTVTTLTLLSLSLPLILLTIDWVKSYGSVGELTVGWAEEPKPTGSRAGRVLAAMSNEGRVQVTAARYTDDTFVGQGQRKSLLEAYQPAEGKRTIFFAERYPVTAREVAAIDSSFKWEILQTIQPPITLDGRIIRFPHWLGAMLLSLPPLPLVLRIRRRWVRRRRGLCVGCGYDLRASTGVCPECGRAIASGRAAVVPTAAV